MLSLSYCPACGSPLYEVDPPLIMCDRLHGWTRTGEYRAGGRLVLVYTEV